MTVYRYAEVKVPARKRVPCAGGCGKKLNRLTTFTATENPFNKNPDGTVRTRAEIREVLLERKRAWEALTDDQWCAECSETEMEARFA